MSISTRSTITACTTIQYLNLVCPLFEHWIQKNMFIIYLFFLIILELLKFLIIHAFNVDIISLNLLQNFLSLVAKMNSSIVFLFRSHFDDLLHYFGCNWQ